MTDEYATLRAAEAAGARIQAYRVPNEDGSAPLSEVDGRGDWCNLTEPVKGSCHPTRYRVHPEDVA